MRNCFVRCCDRYCNQRGKQKRRMFFPPKVTFSHSIKIRAHQNDFISVYNFLLQNPDIFNEWKARLVNNKREFQPTDRVCELHFRADKILLRWEHKINGKIVSLEREKPKLMPDAIPELLLDLSTQWENMPEEKPIRLRTATAAKAKVSKRC